MLQNRKGFTLIELMIVVAIIGILAAVAVPGFMKYIKDSKTTEAKTNLKAIAEGASTFYQAEHASDATGSEFYTRQYPNTSHCKAKEGGNTSGDCGSYPAIQPAYSATAGAKRAGTWNAEPWTSLNFTASAPVYYSYQYNASAGNATVGSAFAVQGVASLDKTNDIDSCFVMNGTTTTSGDPLLSAIMDKSEASAKCVSGTITVPSASTATSTKTPAP